MNINTASTNLFPPQSTQAPAMKQSGPRKSNDPRQPRSVLSNFVQGSNWNNSELLRKKYLKAQNDYLLSTQIGLDFVLNTTEGVEFKIHKTMLLGGSKVWQESAFPDGVAVPGLKTLHLAENFYPILVDRIVAFIYTGTYEIGKGDKPRRLYHATHFPKNKYPTSYARPEFDGGMLHMHMYSLAEEIDFAALQSFAHHNLSRALMMPYVAVSQFKMFVDAAFAPITSLTRVCEDKERWIQDLVATATLIQETRHWTKLSKQGFDKLLLHHNYDDYRHCYLEVKRDCSDILLPANRSRFGQGPVGGNTPQWQSTDVLAANRDGGIRKKAPESRVDAEKRAAAMIRGIKELTLDEDEKTVTLTKDLKDLVLD